MIRDLIERFKLYRKKRKFDDNRLGDFWCDRHWDIIRDSITDPIPIDPSVASVGIAMALYVKGLEAKDLKSKKHLCCLVEREGSKQKLLDGILLRARVEDFDTWKKNQTTFQKEKNHKSLIGHTD